MHQLRGFVVRRDLSDLSDQKRGIARAGQILIVGVGLLAK